MSGIVLYSYFRSSASYRVRIALALKKIDYEYRNINLILEGGKQHSQEYLEINPKAEVPALLIDNVIITQSLPIIEYLEETRPEQGVHLLPKDPISRAHARRIAEIINSGIQPLQNLSLLKALPDSIEKEKWAAMWIKRGFIALEKELGKTAGTFCIGDELTIADICLVPQVFNAERFGVEMSPFPIIKKLYSLLVQHEAFKKAHPQQQPDAV